MSDQTKNAAVAFLNMASSGDVDAAYSKFVADNFKHHDPFFEGSAESLQAAMKVNAKQNPAKIMEVKRAIAEGDFGSHIPASNKIHMRLGRRSFIFSALRMIVSWNYGTLVSRSLSNH